MSSIPVFPLPNTVVFPGMAIPLYIFEARYRKLVEFCLSQERPRFIITLHKEQALRDDALPFYTTGTLVYLAQSSQNPDGTYETLVHGQERCRLIISSKEEIGENDGSSRSLYFSQESLWPLERSDPNQERLTAWDTLETFQSYVKVFFSSQDLARLGDIIPEDLTYQASFICANIRIPAASRQMLLEAPSLEKRFALAQKMMLERLAMHQTKSQR